jgi:hypothetical protein
MLTGAVNIAVFAAFQNCFDLRSSATAEFKPVRAIWQLDVWCYGWQKRQDRGKKRQRCGKVGGKNGNVVSGSGRTHIATPTAVMECARHVCLAIQSSRRAGNLVASRE